MTLGAPNQGMVTPLSWFCSFPKLGSRQCKDMTSGSTFLTSLTRNPQSTIGTDWTALGSTADTVVKYTSAIGWRSQSDHQYGHEVVCTFAPGTIRQVVHSSSGTDYMHYPQSGTGCCNYQFIGADAFNGYTPYTINGMKPGEVVRLALYYWRTW